MRKRQQSHHLSRLSFKDVSQHEFSPIRSLWSKIFKPSLLPEKPLIVLDNVYLLHEGRIKAHGNAGEIKKSHEIREAYLGICIIVSRI